MIRPKLQGYECQSQVPYAGFWLQMDVLVHSWGEEEEARANGFLSPPPITLEQLTHPPQLTSPRAFKDWSQTLFRNSKFLRVHRRVC